jgi:hypothetical protein
MPNGTGVTRPSTARRAAALALGQGEQGLTTEYWSGTDRVLACFCGACGWSGDIVLADRVVGHEAE